MISDEHEQFYLGDESPSPKDPEEDYISSPNVLRFNKTINIKDFYIFNDREMIIKKGQVFNRTAFSTLLSGSVYSAAAQDYLIGITSLSYAPTIGLPKPSLVGLGKTFIVKDEIGGAGTTTITIRSAGEESIDGASSVTINTNYASRSLYTDGANWFIY